ncbi:MULTISPECIES: DUF5955 family protein [Streptomyces]|uniref:DUF5955 family protein n=1 Tax=Streptomyces TaxID=1883 RepID=UPI00345BCC78
MPTERRSNINKGGVQGINYGSGPQAAGGRNAKVTITQHTPAASDLPPAQAALADAVISLRADLARLRDHSPQAVSDYDADYADETLAEAEEESVQLEPSRNMLRQRVHAVAGALVSVGQLAAGVASLQNAYDALFPAP